MTKQLADDIISRYPNGVKTLPWLKHHFTFLTGLAEPQRRSRILLAMQVYVDESGIHGSKFFVMAGLLADAETWLAFSDAWETCLREEPSIAYFKSSEAANLSGEFYKWSDDCRDRKVAALAKIINQHKPCAIFMTIDTHAYAKTVGMVPGPERNVYFWGFQNMVIRCAMHMAVSDIEQRFEIFFDEQNVFSPEVKLFYPDVRDVAKEHFPRLYELLPVDPLFRSDKEILPLQASDFFAYSMFKGLDAPYAEHPLDWVLGHVLNVDVSLYSKHFGPKYLENFHRNSAMLAHEKDWPEMNKAYKAWLKPRKKKR